MSQKLNQRLPKLHRTQNLNLQNSFLTADVITPTSTQLIKVISNDEIRNHFQIIRFYQIAIQYFKFDSSSFIFDVTTLSRRKGEDSAMP